MRKLLPILLGLVACVATAADRRAPGFALMDGKGVWHDLADYRGKPVVLALIQTTCPHCAAFAENLQRVQEKYGDKISVLAVVVPPDTLDKARDFTTGHKLTYSIVFDMGQMCMSYVRGTGLEISAPLRHRSQWHDRRRRRIQPADSRCVRGQRTEPDC
ncbi:MAG: TlpA disulfide reductase family protein [Ignavibacteriota bacterium]